MKRKPNDVNEGIEINSQQVNEQLDEFHTFQHEIQITNKDLLQDKLYKFIKHKQSNIQTALTPNRLAGFEQYPRFGQLSDMAYHGLQPFLKPEFTPNKGHGDFRRDAQHNRLPHTIAHHIRKLQDNQRCLIFPAEMLKDLPGLHVSALHVAFKEADSRGRPCTDAAHSGLNDGTDMQELMKYLGDFHLPQLTELARMLISAQEGGSTLLHKTDVSSAFNTMLLSPEASLLQTFQVQDSVIIPLVAGFGWCAAPAYYNVISGAIHWAHNGGINQPTLTQWTQEQGLTPYPATRDVSRRSLTYVDDSCGRSTEESVLRDSTDLRTIIQRLLGPGAYNKKKTEGPLAQITNIGWQCCAQTYTIKPGVKGRCKLLYWVFRGLNTSRPITLHDLHSAVGVLRWYSAVIPMAFTWQLQNDLTQAQRRQARDHNKTIYLRLSRASVRELEWWQWVLIQDLHTPMLHSPAWFLAKKFEDRPCLDVFTDASTEYGGGFYIPETSYGQMQWSKQEKECFGKSELTDINAFEFVTAVCAVVSQRENLQSSIVCLHVDNTSAVTWLNKRRTSQLFGQNWMRLLISTLITYNITMISKHIPGVKNTNADYLSRCPVIEQGSQPWTKSLKRKQMLSAESRQHIWRMSSTPLSIKEYQNILATLEKQDEISSTR